jgi:hypothetical protein
MEKGQNPGDREATPGGLVGRLAEGTLQIRTIWHADTRAIDEPSTVAAPQSNGFSQRLACLDKTSKQSLEDGQWEPGPSLAVG